MTNQPKRRLELIGWKWSRFQEGTSINGTPFGVSAQDPDDTVKLIQPRSFAPNLSSTISDLQL